MSGKAELKRSLGVLHVTLYGLGTILGAGIYVLLGEVAGEAGAYAPVSFLLAGLVAGLSAFAYAELSSRFPKSAGEAVYTHEAFGLRALSTAVGWSVVMIGVVSAATIANGFQGYLHVFLDMPGWAAIAALVLTLGVIAAWGIGVSVTIAAAITVVEILGLVMVVALSSDSLATLPARLPELTPPMESAAWTGIGLGAFLAFYAFIGFEDIVNIAEEVKDPSRTLPMAIFLALGISATLYLLVTLSAVLTLPLETLSTTTAPMASIVAKRGSLATGVISLVSIVAVINGALIQVIMASRILYGMGRRAMAPALLSRVSTLTRTPLIATAAVTVTVLALALWLPLVTLAEATSFITLSVFALMNLALFRFKYGGGASWRKGCAIWVPAAGFVACVLFVVLRGARVFGP